MSEVLHEYDYVVTDPDGEEYRARAIARPSAVNTWEGWIEFIPLSGGEPLCTPRETTQPNRIDVEYWATGLSEIYLDGAIRRTPKFTPHAPPVAPSHPPIFDAPAPSRFEAEPALGVSDAPLNPFAAYGKGEDLLRKQLIALEEWQLRRVIGAYKIADPGSPFLLSMKRAELAELIIDAARERLGVTG